MEQRLFASLPVEQAEKEWFSWVCLKCIYFLWKNRATRAFGTLQTILNDNENFQWLHNIFGIYSVSFVRREFKVWWLRNSFAPFYGMIFQTLFPTNRTAQTQCTTKTHQSQSRILTRPGRTRKTCVRKKREWNRERQKFILPDIYDTNSGGFLAVNRHRKTSKV